MASRPYKIEYRSNGAKVGKIVSCGSPEGVIKAATVRVYVGHAEYARASPSTTSSSLR